MEQRNSRDEGQRRRSRVTFVLVLAALVTSSAVALAATSRYSDVSDTNLFLADIEWLAETGITKGCTTDEFCPQDNVTREQMAAFLHRLATSRAVDASTVQGLAPVDLQGQTGPAGPTGATGATGADGVTGATGADGVTPTFYRVVTASAVVAGSGTVDAACSAGDVVTGGGFKITTTGTDVLSSEPAADLSKWQVSYNVSVAATVSAYAICADITP